MKSNKNLGIWMDYSTADLIKPGHEVHETIRSEMSGAVKAEAMKRGEKHLHNKEQQVREDYFKEIAGKIRQYDQVLLFGPTDAKAELQHYLEKDADFRDVKVTVKSSDKLTEPEKKAFVKTYFEAG